MNYSDFFNMLPELTLIAALLVVFFMDFFCPNTAERKTYLGTGTILMLLPVISTCLGSEWYPPSTSITSFGSKQAKSVM